MAYITKTQLKEILDKRPVGTTPRQMIETLQKRGHTIEGLGEPALGTKEKPLPLPTWKETPILPSEEKPGLLKSLWQTTFGTKGLGGIAEMPGRVLSVPGLAKQQTGLAETRMGMSDITTKLIETWKKTPEGTQKEKLKTLINENFRSMGETSRMEEYLKQKTLTPREATATTMRAGTTAASFGMPAATSAKGAAAISGALGASYGAATAIEEGKDWKDTARNAFISGAVSAVVGGALYKAGEALKGLPEKLVKRAARIKKELTTGQKRGMEVVLDKDRWFEVGKLYSDIEQGIAAVNDQIDNTIREGVGKVDDIAMNEIYEKSIGSTTAPKNFIKGVQTRVPLIKRDRVSEIMTKETINNTDGNWLRKLIDKEVLPKRFFETGQGAATVKSIGQFNRALRNTIKTNTNTWKEFATESGYIEAKKILDKIFQYEEQHWNLGLRNVAKAAGISVLIPGKQADVPAIAAQHIITAPAMQTRIARGLSRVGEIKIPEAVSAAGRTAYTNLLSRLTGR